MLVEARGSGRAGATAHAQTRPPSRAALPFTAMGLAASVDFWDFYDRPWALHVAMAGKREAEGEGGGGGMFEWREVVRVRRREGRGREGEAEGRLREGKII